MSGRPQEKDLRSGKPLLIVPDLFFRQTTGERFPFYALTISFPGSNNGVTQAFPSQNQECLLEGMKRIFEHIGGVPPRLRFDNMTTAVAQVLKDGERVLTDGFTRFKDGWFPGDEDTG